MNYAINPLILELNLIDALSLLEAKGLPDLLDDIPRCRMLRDFYPDRVSRDECRQWLYRALVRERGVRSESVERQEEI